MIADIEILFEDNHIIAINKKPSQIVQPDKTNDVSLEELVKQFLKQKYSKPGEVFLGIVHRLDRPVSGIVIFAKTSKALVRLNAAFQNRSIQKTYLAIVKNKPSKNVATLTDYLIRDTKLNKARLSSPTNKNAKKAELTYRLMQSIDNYHLLEISPKTGRHHQIRIQLANAQMPIKGDLKYGFKRSNKDASICLHAYKIVFEHPVTKELITLTAPVPQTDVWQNFKISV